MGRADGSRRLRACEPNRRSVRDPCHPRRGADVPGQSRGFEFWVRRDGVPIAGLEKTISAVAAGHGATVDLAVPPVDGSGFYVLDQSAAGRAFDPRGGGAWTLVLTGSIVGTPVNASIPVTFPSYPRVGVPIASQPVVAAGAGLSPAGGTPAWLVGLATTAGVGGLAVLALFARRPSGSAKPRATDQVPVP